MSVPALDASTVIEPIRQLSDAGGTGVLCVITHVDGPSYRPLGAMMAAFLKTDGASARSPLAVSKPILRFMLPRRWT